MDKAKGLILAGGFGSRMGELTKHTPKVMLPLLGKPVLQYSIEHLAKYGVKDIAVSLHYMAKKVQDYFGDGSNYGVSISYFIENQPRGSGGALSEASAFFDTTMVVINGDVVTKVNVTKLLEWHKRHRGIATLVVHPSEHPIDSDIIEIDPNSKVTRVWRPNIGESFENLANAGMFVLEPGILKYIDESRPQSIEKDLLPKALEQNEALFAYQTDEYIKDMGTLKRYAQVKLDFN